MSLESIQTALRQRFDAPLPEFCRRRVLFWRDEAGEFDALPEALDLPGAKVLMKAGKEVPRLKELLAGRPGLTARMVTDCGLPTQRVYRDLREADGPTGYFSTVIIEEE